MQLYEIAEIPWTTYPISPVVTSHKTIVQQPKPEGDPDSVKHKARPPHPRWGMASPSSFLLHFPIHANLFYIFSLAYPYCDVNKSQPYATFGIGFFDSTEFSGDSPRLPYRKRVFLGCRDHTAGLTAHPLMDIWDVPGLGFPWIKLLRTSMYTVRVKIRFSSLR